MAGAFVLGYVASLPIEKDREVFVASEAPLAGLPPENRTAANNNMIARLGWAPDLDGTAVVYALEADGLVALGRFRTDLSLNEMAAALRISAKSIANPRSPDEIDPDAELFRAQSGLLTDKSKQIERTFRIEQLAGKMPGRDDHEWVIKEFSFTLNRLKHPSEEEKSVLCAIVAAASEIMPVPGDGVRATGKERSYFEYGPLKLSIGLLPPAGPMTDAREVDSGPTPARMRLARGDGDPRAQTWRSRSHRMGRRSRASTKIAAWCCGAPPRAGASAVSSATTVTPRPLRSRPMAGS
jgi:hypothetical protein